MHFLDNNSSIKTDKKILLSAISVMLIFLSTVSADESNSYELKLKAPITTWDEAIPLDNAMLGGLLWGGGNKVNLSLDRGDLWDETLAPDILEGNWNFANMKILIKENWNEYARRYDNIFNHTAPTKLPGGRLVLTLGNDKKPESMKGCIVSYDFTNTQKKGFISVGSKKIKAAAKGKLSKVNTSGGFASALYFDGTSFLEISHDKALNCNAAVTVEAWIYARSLGGRIIDKGHVGSTQGYNMDTYANSVRLISNASSTNPMSRQKLKLNTWTHIAGTIDGKTGDIAIYINGRKVEIQ